jgi:hypothetical protein
VLGLPISHGHCGKHNLASNKPTPRVQPFFWCRKRTAKPLAQESEGTSRDDRAEQGTADLSGRGDAQLRVKLHARSKSSDGVLSQSIVRGVPRRLLRDLTFVNLFIRDNDRLTEKLLPPP